MLKLRCNLFAHSVGKILQKCAKLYLNTELDQKVFPLKKIFELKSLKITINFE